ncbi:MAG TPA: hypothetical protein PLI09_21320 [Candidatus Hydrogenedentes bacterium]|mgnify:CR=1 FL=1|nr:hypothetical protein [Candidatus Hydrogenedentota bacterium]
MRMTFCMGSVIGVVFVTSAVATDMVQYACEVESWQVAPGMTVEAACFSRDSTPLLWKPLASREIFLTEEAFRIGAGPLLQMLDDTLEWTDTPPETVAFLGGTSAFLSYQHPVDLYLERQPKGFSHHVTIEIQSVDVTGIVSLVVNCAPLASPIRLTPESSWPAGVQRSCLEVVTNCQDTWSCVADAVPGQETVLLFIRVSAYIPVCN